MVLEPDEICGADPEEENLPAGQDKPDLQPEFCRYKDEGCEYFRSCLKCPFPRCIYDESRGRQRLLKKQRDKEIKRLYRSGRRVKELARLFEVSRRTINRVINGKGKESNDK